MRKIFSILGKIVLVLAAVYAGLFAVFYFDLDGKLLYNKVEPLLVKHYDKMKRRDPMSVRYDMER